MDYLGLRKIPLSTFCIASCGAFLMGVAGRSPYYVIADSGVVGGLNPN